ncbi:MAG: transglycosylase SLT domain-containing protein [Halopseudomonas sp.]
MRSWFCKLPLAGFTIILAACASSPPDNITNSCEIFYDKSDWYDEAKDSFEKWGVPIHVQLAIIHQESSFKYDAKPPKDYLLGFIPWGRKSSAYGYAQVKDGTWDWYKEKTGNWGADRDDFGDAVDFIGWYGSVSYKMLGISKWDARKQYLAYHEGHGGYKRKTYNNKAWLVDVSKKVERNAARYRAQLGKCRDSLESSWW